MPWEVHDVSRGFCQNLTFGTELPVLATQTPQLLLLAGQPITASTLIPI